MTNMRSRMEAIGATFEVISDATGTKVQVRRPAEGLAPNQRNGDA